MCKVCGNPASETRFHQWPLIQVKLHGAMEKNMYNNLELLERLQHAAQLRPRRTTAEPSQASTKASEPEDDEEFSEVTVED